MQETYHFSIRPPFQNSAVSPLGFKIVAERSPSLIQTALSTKIQHHGQFALGSRNQTPPRALIRASNRPSAKRRVT